MKYFKLINIEYFKEVDDTTKVGELRDSSLCWIVLDTVSCFEDVKSFLTYLDYKKFKVITEQSIFFLVREEKDWVIV